MEPTKKPISVDCEPKTLSSDQMRQLREQALRLLNTQSSEEAQKLLAGTSENDQENSTKDVNSEAQEMQQEKKDATNPVQEEKNEKMEAPSSNDDDEEFEEEFDSSSSDDSLLASLFIDQIRDVFSAPF